MAAYYNENDAFAAAWLRELAGADLIAPGHVDERSIVDVKPADLEGYDQCHFFAGIGGWSYALRLAGWPDDRPVWTGSCPCQPLSVAGLGKGHVDERHLWPAFHGLISQRRPPTIFGEQVSGKAGREWLAGVRADLEGDGYAVGAADLCAASAGAPHIRQRLWWVADAGSGCIRRGEQHRSNAGAPEEISGEVRQQRLRPDAGADGDVRRLANTDGGIARHGGPQGRHIGGYGADEWAPWSSGVGLACTDGKTRRTQSGIFPLAHGVPNRVGRLRAAGNAIVPQVAAQFIGAYMNEIIPTNEIGAVGPSPARVARP